MLALMLALGCRDRPPQATPSAEADRHDGSEASNEPSMPATFSTKDKLAAREAKIDALRTCRPEDWPALLLMATDRYDWGDDLAERSPRNASISRCRALNALDSNLYLYAGPGHQMLLRRRVATAFSRPEVVAALRDAISGKVPVPQGCSVDAFESILEIVPLQQLRPEVQAHASERRRAELLRELDRDRDYNPGPRVAQLERWAAEITPTGFERVLEALGHGYTWNDGRPPPSAAEQKAIDEHAVHLIHWLRVIAPWRSPDCGLAEAVRSGRLGSLVVARLDHHEFEIRRTLLDLISTLPVNGSRARIVEIETADPDPHVRKLAAETRVWIDRGGKTKEALDRYEPVTGSTAEAGVRGSP